MAQSLMDLAPALMEMARAGADRKAPPKRKRPPPYGYGRLRKKLKSHKKKEGQRER